MKKQKLITNLKDLEKQAPIEIYCKSALGLELPEVTGLAAKMPCPLPHAHDENAQLVVFKNGRVKCTSYDQPLSVWDLAMEAEGLTFREAVEAVCEFFGIKDQIQYNG